MGTNYYMVKGERYAEGGYDHPLNPLLKWGTGRPPMIHIGKSSGGWCFALRVYPDHGVHTLADWKVFVERLMRENWAIEDEYGKLYWPKELWPIVEREGWVRQDGQPLTRHTVDNTYCIGQGEGLYDYMVGEFS